MARKPHQPLLFSCSETENSYLQIFETLMRFGKMLRLHSTIGSMVAHFALRYFLSAYSTIVCHWPPRYPDLRHFNYTAINLMMSTKRRTWYVTTFRPLTLIKNSVPLLPFSGQQQSDMYFRWWKILWTTFIITDTDTLWFVFLSDYSYMVCLFKMYDLC
jgi:hypothetical protein